MGSSYAPIAMDGVATFSNGTGATLTTSVSCALSHTASSPHHAGAGHVVHQEPGAEGTTTHQKPQGRVVSTICINLHGDKAVGAIDPCIPNPPTLQCAGGFTFPVLSSQAAAGLHGRAWLQGPGGIRHVHDPKAVPRRRRRRRRQPQLPFGLQAPRRRQCHPPRTRIQCRCAAIHAARQHGAGVLLHYASPGRDL